MSQNKIPNHLCIKSFVHCSKCIAEVYDLPVGVEKSPRAYAQLEIGFTPLGLQVWCKRHDINVMHIDYEGKSPFPANTTSKRA